MTGRYDVRCFLLYVQVSHTNETCTIHKSEALKEIKNVKVFWLVTEL